MTLNQGDQQMEVKCRDKRNEKEWKAKVKRLYKTNTGFEASIVADDWLFHLVVGEFQYGYYLCIPNWNVGIELASYNDTFWNLEQLVKVMKRKNAISIVTSIKYIYEHLETITN